MPYARIFIKDENKQQDVNVDEILDFWSVYLGKGDPAKKVFRLISEDKFINCQVLRIADTLQILREEVSAKRSRVPKLNATLFEQNDDPDDVRLRTMKRKRNTGKETSRKKSAQIDTVGDILDAYHNALEADETANAKGKENNPATKQEQKRPAGKQKQSKPATKPVKRIEPAPEPVKQIEPASKQIPSRSVTEQTPSEPPVTKPKVAKINYSSSEGETEIVNGSDSEDLSSIIVRRDPEPNQDLENCYENIGELEKEVRRWKQKYVDLKESKQYPLTEETGQRILLVLTDDEKTAAKQTVVADNKAAQQWTSTVLTESQIVKQQTTASSCSDVGDPDKSMELFSGSSVIMDFGGGVTLKRSVYNSFARKLHPSHFFTQFAQCVFGTETLANRCVRGQSNVKEQELEEDKKEIVVNHFLQWLKVKARYPAHLITIEEAKISKYFNSAITSARKKVKRNTEGSEVSGEGNETKKVLENVHKEVNTIDKKNTVPSSKLDVSHTTVTLRSTTTTSKGRVTKKKTAQTQSQDADGLSSSPRDFVETTRHSDGENNSTSTIEDSGLKAKKIRVREIREMTEGSKTTREQKKVMREQLLDNGQQSDDSDSAETVLNSRNDENNFITESTAQKYDSDPSPVRSTASKGSDEDVEPHGDD